MKQCAAIPAPPRAWGDFRLALAVLPAMPVDIPTENHGTSARQSRAPDEASEPDLGPIRAWLGVDTVGGFEGEGRAQETQDPARNFHVSDHGATSQGPSCSDRTVDGWAGAPRLIPEGLRGEKQTPTQKVIRADRHRLPRGPPPPLPSHSRP